MGFQKVSVAHELTNGIGVRAMNFLKNGRKFWAHMQFPGESSQLFPKGSMSQKKLTTVLRVCVCEREREKHKTAVTGRSLGEVHCMSHPGNGGDPL